ncbi:hypothetical protein [Leptolyngbya sp. NIES-2104]|uniref:hypothetical protein n=1 Tax=Leptolyngbya sp. NIES-2104 TaxID=1552121 RepID=UPI0006EC5A1C|nr:hypothetical protein [Leptolyngbya sp. NIES-2104]GAP99732.1 hypothetical protein NIES2104_62980 [Leptolyngbya sp. NIES-2104]
MTQPLIGYHFINQDSLPQQCGTVRDYLIGSNGIFVRAERPDFSAIIPVQSLSLPGLALVTPRLTLRRPRVGANLVTQMIAVAQTPQPFVETLFYLQWQEDWQLIVPSQLQTQSSVQPILSQTSNNCYQTATIEVHSHPPNATEFSAEDSKIATGFRIFAILTHLDTAPKLITRVGIDGIFWSIPTDWVFDVPSFETVNHANR